MRRSVALTVTPYSILLACFVLACCARAVALDPSLDISQYAHTAWIRDGFAKGAIRSIAQAPDGYLWLGTEFGLLRFDGMRAVPWQPPGGEKLPNNMISGLLVSRDDTLWIGTLKGLVSCKDRKFTQYVEVTGIPIGGLLEDREQAVWFGTQEPSKARLCAIRSGKVECYGAGTFGSVVIALNEDHRHNLWVSAQTGLWRCAPGPPQRYAFPRGVYEANSLIEDNAGTLPLVRANPQTPVASPEDAAGPELTGDPGQCIVFNSSGHKLFQPIICLPAGKWEVDDDVPLTVSHGGGEWGTSTFIMMSPQQRNGIVVMINLNGANANELGIQLFKIVSGSNRTPAQ